MRNMQRSWLTLEKRAAGEKLAALFSVGGCVLGVYLACSLKAGCFVVFCGVHVVAGF